MDVAQTQNEERRRVGGSRSAPTGPVAADETGQAAALERSELLRIAFVAVAAAAVWWHLWEPFPHLSVVGVAGLLVGAWPIFREALQNALARRMTMELSMSIAIVAAAAISEFFTALIITLFVLVAEVLEGLTVSRGRRAIADLLDVLPRSVSVRRDSSVQDVSANDLRAGDAVLVNPGGALPVDGIVLGGHSFVDESRITGESMPVEKVAGCIVYAGSINQSGALELRADRVGKDTSYGKIIEAVENAERSRAPVQRLADQLAGYLVYFALGAAALTFLVTRNVRSTISVVIVAGACGIAAGTPLAILGAIGRAARLGAIVKGGLYLELLGKLDTLVLDKTGTLTFGRPDVRDVRPAPGSTADEVVAVAAAAELRSEHPLGRAIVERARTRGIQLSEPESFAYTPGKGVTAAIGGVEVLVGNRVLLREGGVSLSEDQASDESSTQVLVARAGNYLGTIALDDTVRPDASEAVAALRGMGLRVLLFTGDKHATALAVGRELGLDEVESEVLPDQKLARVRELSSSGRRVGMLGDGVNDAPALVAAQVGVAMGSGTDVARESADVVLLGNDLAKFVETVRVARWTRRVIWQNFAGTLAVDGLGIGLAAVGVLSPLLAAFVHVASELAFILNSTRLLPSRPRSRVPATHPVEVR
jgi:P-type Cu+ transporter